jgi:sialic acid synthase SpsE
VKILHCVVSYPTPDAEAGLAVLRVTPLEELR